LFGAFTSCDLTDPIAGTEYDDLYYAKSDVVQQSKLRTTAQVPSNSPFDASTTSSGNSDFVEDYYDSSYIANLNKKYSQDLAYQYSDPREENPSLWNPSTQLGVSMGTAMGVGFSSIGVQTGWGNPYYDPYGFNSVYSPWNPYGFNSPYYGAGWGNPYAYGMGYYYATPIRQIPVYRPNPIVPQEPRSYASNPRDHTKENPNEYRSPRQQQPINRSAKNWDTQPTYSQPSRNSLSSPSYSSPNRSSSTYSSPARSSSPSRGSSSPRSARSGGGSPR